MQGIRFQFLVENRIVPDFMERYQIVNRLMPAAEWEIFPPNVSKNFLVQYTGHELDEYEFFARIRIPATEEKTGFVLLNSEGGSYIFHQNSILCIKAINKLENQFAMFIGQDEHLTVTNLYPVISENPMANPKIWLAILGAFAVLPTVTRELLPGGEWIQLVFVGLFLLILGVFFYFVYKKPYLM